MFKHGNTVVCAPRPLPACQVEARLEEIMCSIYATSKAAAQEYGTTLAAGEPASLALPGGPLTRLMHAAAAPVCCPGAWWAGSAGQALAP